MNRYKIEFIPKRGVGSEQQEIWKSLACGAPITPASECLPDWWKNLKRKNNNAYNNKPTSTAKTCPGIFDFTRAGYILSMWADVHFLWNCGKGDEWQIKTSSILQHLHEPFTSHSHKQVEGAPFLEDSCRLMIKLNSPWYIQVPTGVSLFLTQPFYHINNDFTVCPGIIDPEINRISNKELNVFLKFNVSDKPIKILRGQPLMQIIPFVRAEYEFENNVPENLDEIDMLNIAQRAIIDDEDSHLKVNRIPKNYNA